jgi:OOP family OmpA-OmpF porin
MRSRTLSLVSILVGAAGTLSAGCATPEAKAVCHPVAGWTTPVFRCAAPAPMVAAVPPPPEPAAPPAPEPEPAAPPPAEPPPTASLKTEKIELSETVQFETDSAVLVARSKVLLDDVARELNEHPEVKHILIEGYTDAKASKAYNLKLSEQRVASVKAYLIDKGIDGSRLRTKGFGETHPIASNKTEEGRAKNRRVEFRVVERKRR